MGIFENNQWAKPEQSAMEATDPYIQRHLMSGQWRDFLSALGGELFENFPEEEATGFFRALGRRLGRQLAQPKLATLQELEAAMNERLDEMRWGEVSLTLVDRDIHIRHRHLPELPLANPGHAHWRQGMLAVLEGLYTVWLQAQGASSDLQAEFQNGSSSGVAEFRFGIQT